MKKVVKKLTMDKPRILLIDDNQNFLDLFSSLADTDSYDIVVLTSAETALEVLRSKAVDLIISDVQMPGMTGIDLFSKVQDLSPDIPFILITAYGSTEDAVEAVKKGAFHYFEKPIDDKLDLLWSTIREALTMREMRKELGALRREKLLRQKAPVSIIGQSEGIKKVMSDIKEVSGLPITVLIQGETGTGKELVARAIHHLSDRRDMPFFAVSCCEFATGILESELFGHEKGAFTGAIQQKIGLLEVAHKGTLLLDEIGEDPLPLQSKLLRVLETKTFRRVGGTSPIYSDFRLLATTNRNLEAEVASGHFRKDLFYRLNVYPIKIPPLRERREDIPLIAEFYLKRFSQAYGRQISGFSALALLALREYEWPGNVRELVNVVERATITCPDSIVTTKHLPLGEREHQEISDLNLSDVEKFFIATALRRTGNNKTKAAELLGISRKTLTEKVKSYGWDQERDDLDNPYS